MENSSASTFRFFPYTAAFPQAPSAPQGAPKGAGANTRRQTAMGKGIDERSHEAIHAYLKHKDIEVLEEM